MYMPASRYCKQYVAMKHWQKIYLLSKLWYVTIFEEVRAPN